MMSNPLTQKRTAIENNIGVKLNSPVTAKYAPNGAKDSPMPKIK